CYFVADHHAAAIERPAPADAILLPVDLGRRRGANAGAALLDERLRRTFDVERHFLRHAAHRQIANQLELAGAGGLGALRLEGDGRELLHGEEVVALEVRIPLFVVRGDRRRIDRDVGFDRRDVLAVERDGAFGLAERAADRTDHHVLDGEAGGGVAAVDGPG